MCINIFSPASCSSVPWISAECKVPADAVLLSLPFPANFILPSSTTLCSTSSIISSPLTFKFPSMVKSFPVVTFPFLSIVNAFIEVVPLFVANIILSSTSAFTDPSPSATTPSVTELKDTLRSFPTIKEFFVFFTVLEVPITKVFSLLSYFVFAPTNMHSVFAFEKLLGSVFPIIILSLGLLSLIEPLLDPVITLIAGFPIVPPDISIAEPWASNVFLRIPLTFWNPPIIKCLSV